jgi:tetratricopeptide (TPR) repeat protein
MQRARVAPADRAGALRPVEAPRAEAWPPPGSPAPLKGDLADIARAIKSGNLPGALGKARAWHERAPGDVLALIGYGEALEATRDYTRAARIYGSIIDLFPARADLRRFAGERLERIGQAARTLAVDTYRRAVEERPDHVTGHRLLAYALLRAGQRAEAFDAILAGIDRAYPSGRFAGADRVMAEDAGLIGAAYAAASPGKRAEIAAALAKRSIALPTTPSTRFIMYWETDANDVDFHIQDARGGHAFYSNKVLPSGGELYADITTGYGPECFTIPGTPKAGPYRLSINYYSQGPMGYGMGLLQIMKHDGKGGLTFEDRPYVIMNDHAYVDLGTFK